MRDKLLIGRFIDTDSWVHQLDPRAKISAMLAYVILIIMAGSWPVMSVLMVFSLAIMLMTRIPLKIYLKAAKPLRILMLFIFVVQCFTVKESAEVLSIGGWSLYLGGVLQGLLSVTRMVLLVSFTALLTFTTSTGQLNQGLERMLSPFRGLGLSPERLTLMISIALRFIPSILEETQQILKAQASRGADLSELPWKEKGKMLVSLLVPVTVGAFRRAEDLVQAMEARGYRLGQPRSQYHALTWRSQDWLFISLFLLMAAIEAGILVHL